MSTDALNHLLTLLKFTVYGLVVGIVLVMIFVVTPPDSLSIWLEWKQRSWLHSA